MERIAGWPMVVFLAAIAVSSASGIHAQELPPEIARYGVDVPKPKIAADSVRQDHRFWNKENDWLFAGVGASRTLDYFSTLNMRRRGRKEILLTNDVVDNHAAFAAIEAAGTGISIGASYFFHRYGHHKLERWTSLAHLSLATTGAVRNYCLKTAHPIRQSP